MESTGVANRSVEVALCKPHPMNYNQHNDAQIADLRMSLRRFGQVRSIVVQEDGAGGFLLVAGHGLHQAAKLEGLVELRADVIPIDWPPVKVVAYLAADNELARQGTPDEAQLAALIARIQEEADEELARLAAGGADELAALIASMKAPEAPADDPEPQIDLAEELREKWGVELGQIWQLGEHRLICGDCTDRAIMDKLMGGDKAQICWTDPPWNVAYGEGFRGGESGLGWKKRTIINDNLGEKFGGFADQFCWVIHECLVPGGILYMAMSAQEWGLIMNTLETRGFHWSSTIIWAKDCLVVSRKDYHTQYEPIWYGWKSDAARVCPVKDRTQSDLWQIPRPKRSDEHPTMKPVALVERSLNNSSQKGNLVLEPFSGSGTTIIACERLGRKCRAAEIAPGYVAVGIQRWVDMTGGEPVLIA